MIGEAAEFYVLIGSPCPTRLHEQQEQKQHDGMFQVVLFYIHHNRRFIKYLSKKIYYFK